MAVSTQPYTLKLSDAEMSRYRRMAALAREAEAEQWSMAGVQPGACVADIGCGPAAVLAELESIVRPDGWVDGVEPDPAARALAEAYLESRGATNARIMSGEAGATRLNEGAYDTVMMRHVLLHNSRDAVEILEHLASLLRPGGHLFLAETDLNHWSFEPTDPDMAEERQRFKDLLGRQGNDVGVGSNLGRLLKDAGMEVVDLKSRFDVHWAQDMTDSVTSVQAARESILAAGMASEQDARRWDEARRRYFAKPKGKYFCVSVFTAVARRPL